MTYTICIPLLFLKCNWDPWTDFPLFFYLMYSVLSDSNGVYLNISGYLVTFSNSSYIKSEVNLNNKGYICKTMPDDAISLFKTL